MLGCATIFCQRIWVFHETTQKLKTFSRGAESNRGFGAIFLRRALSDFWGVRDGKTSERPRNPGRSVRGVFAFPSLAQMAGHIYIYIYMFCVCFEPNEALFGANSNLPQN